MAVRRAPLVIGTEVRIRAPRDSRVMVTAPDSTQINMPAPRGVITVTLDQVGTWRYKTTAGEGEYVVIDAQLIEEEAAPTGVVEGG